MINQKQSIVSIVGGGWSFSQIPHNVLPGYVIAVNSAAIHLQRRPDEIVSMDRQWTEHHIHELCTWQVNAYLRRSAVQNLHGKIQGRPWLHVFDCDNESFKMIGDAEGVDAADQYPEEYEMTEHPYTLNGTNSGMCALNRAYKVAEDVVFLFGFDMQFGPKGQKHWYPDDSWGYQPSPGKMRAWAPQFRAIAEQFKQKGIRVYNVSNRTLIDAFLVVWFNDNQKEGWDRVFGEYTGAMDNAN